MELPQLPQADLTFHDVFDEEENNKEAQTVHHIRANSSIMQVKKILGGFSSVYCQPMPSIGSVRGLWCEYIANILILHHSR